MKLINININKYFHMIPLWKSPTKLPVELPVELPVGSELPTPGLKLGQHPMWASPPACGEAG